eukprot:7739617-Pyramimonas_sp.AAC.1
MPARTTSDWSVKRICPYAHVQAIGRSIGRRKRGYILTTNQWSAGAEAVFAGGVAWRGGESCGAAGYHDARQRARGGKGQTRHLRRHGAPPLPSALTPLPSIRTPLPSTITPYIITPSYIITPYHMDNILQEQQVRPLHWPFAFFITSMPPSIR